MLSAMFVACCGLLVAEVSALRGGRGDPVGATVGLLQSAPVEVPELDSQAKAASGIMEQLGAAPVTAVRAGVLDPLAGGAYEVCDPDYSQPCPASFVNVGSLQGGARQHCAPGESYVGPCTGEARSFSGLSASAKARWSALCLANWPCATCTRDFADPCPAGWSVTSGSVCAPPASYSGPCGASVDFAGFSPAMLARWSSDCGAFWPCA